MSRKLRGLSRDTFQSLRVRNFRLFFAGQLISQVGNWMTMIAMALLVLRLDGSGLDVGILTACQFAPLLVLGPWAGLVADRSDKRTLLMTVQVLAMVQSFVLAALVFSGEPPLWAINLVALAGGFAFAFDNPTRRAFVVEMVPEAQVHNAVSLNSALMTSSRIVGPALAGLLASTVGFGWTFLADGLSYLAVIGALYLMNPDELRRPPATPRARGQVRDGLRYVRTVPDLWVPLVMMALIGTLAFNFQVVMPLFVVRDLGGQESAFTLLFSVMSLGSFVGALVTARRTRIELHHLVAGATGFGFSMAALALAPNLAAAFPIGVLVGWFSIAFLTAATAITQVRADPAMRGRVLALQAMVFLGSTPLGGPALGAISDAWGARAGLAVGAGACLAAAAVGQLAGRRLAATPAEADLAPDERPSVPLPIPG